MRISRKDATIVRVQRGSGTRRSVGLVAMEGGQQSKGQNLDFGRIQCAWSIRRYGWNYVVSIVKAAVEELNLFSRIEKFLKLSCSKRFVFVGGVLVV